ncbi:MAG TPA: hypothetical protein VGS19_29300 [Streptosporangiaceae bacterium]|nr:hypothetical protein [Streptosporangiaceae bacterium]
MVGRLAFAASVTSAVLASVTACATTSAQVFHPAGAVPVSSGGQGSGGTARVATAPGGYRFPASISVEVAAAPAGSSTDSAILTGYQDYVLALWAGVASHGRDSAYHHETSGNASTYVQQEVRYFSRGRTLQGTIRYSALTVTSVFYGDNANVTACVDTSGFRVVSASTGTLIGPVFPRIYAHYLEDVSEVRGADGTWFVSHTGSFPTSTSEGATCR